MNHSNFKNQLELAYKFVKILKWDLDKIKIEITDYEIQFKLPCLVTNGVRTANIIRVKKTDSLKNKLFVVQVCSTFWEYDEVIKYRYKYLTDITSISKDEIFNKSLSMNIITNYEEISEMFEVMNNYHEPISVTVSLLDPCIIKKFI